MVAWTLFSYHVYLIKRVCFRCIGWYVYDKDASDKNLKGNEDFKKDLANSLGISKNQITGIKDGKIEYIENGETKYIDKTTAIS